MWSVYSAIRIEIFFSSDHNVLQFVSVEYCGMSSLSRKEKKNIQLLILPNKYNYSSSQGPFY